MADQNKLSKFAEKKYRDNYLQSRVRGFIAYQIQALREKLGLTQAQFAELTAKKQSTVSRLESTEYGKVSVQTLLDVACACDVALIVRFASYDELLDQTGNMEASALQPRSIQETLALLRQASIPAGGAFRHFLEFGIDQGPRTAQEYKANDNANDLASGAALLAYRASSARLAGVHQASAA
ncbi:helix-turn-helix transcriptional regulator [Bradyrhizobium sp. 173]|uniref:helix-turn-helix domain-containing protein n=1 Tax=Bradyrhizobium sp. 173 TaxID=2782644 RepID=UPI001FF77F0B|nr:helix-turn-helix transcriptional regulator [Bradyrhizobium sp. 173]